MAMCSPVHCDSADKGVTLKMTTESETPGYPWATTTGKIPSPDTVPFVLVVRRDKVPGSVSNLFKNVRELPLGLLPNARLNPPSPLLSCS